MYTIKRAADRAGLTAATLRAWERRYGVGAATRTDAGYRLYDDSAVASLRAMKSLIDGGWSVRAAAEEVRRRATTGSSATAEPASSDSAGADRPTGPGLVEMAANLDSIAVGSTLDERFATASFESVVDDWLLPELRAVGMAWEAGDVSVAGEHLVAGAVGRRLARAYDATDGHDGPEVVIGLPPGSRHDLGLLAFAVAARRAGMATTWLGADVPTEDWALAVEARAADAVVLAVPMEADVETLTHTISAINAAARGDVPPVIAVGGRAQDHAPASCVRLGDRIGPAVRRLATELGI